MKLEYWKKKKKVADSIQIQLVDAEFAKFKSLNVKSWCKVCCQVSNCNAFICLNWQPEVWNWMPASRSNEMRNWKWIRSYSDNCRLMQYGNKFIVAGCQFYENDENLKTELAAECEFHCLFPAASSNETHTHTHTITHTNRERERDTHTHTEKQLRFETGCQMSVARWEFDMSSHVWTGVGCKLLVPSKQCFWWKQKLTHLRLNIFNKLPSWPLERSIVQSKGVIQKIVIVAFIIETIANSVDPDQTPG